MIVNFAKKALADELGTDADITSWKYIGFGNGTAKSVLTDTALGAEFSGGSYARLTATQSSGGDFIYKLSGQWTNNTGAAVTVREVGIFNAGSAGDLVARGSAADGDFVAMEVPAGEKVTVDAWHVAVKDDSEV